jgi:hypothetical protein
MALVSKTVPKGPAVELTDGDLRRLAIVAQMDREQFFATYGRWRQLYGDRFICTVLCDEGPDARGYNVWNFFREHPDAALPYRRKRVWPVEDSRFGRCLDHPAFAGRSVAVISRSIPAGLLDDAGETLRRYLQTGRSASARLLRDRRLVLLDPAEDRGVVVWPDPGPEAPRVSAGPSAGQQRSRWRRP